MSSDQSALPFGGGPDFQYGSAQTPQSLAPQIEILVGIAERPDQLVRVPAILDTGATRTGIPRSVIEQLGTPTFTVRQFRTPGSLRTQDCRLFSLRVQVAQCHFERLEVVELLG